METRISFLFVHFTSRLQHDRSREHGAWRPATGFLYIFYVKMSYQKIKRTFIDSKTNYPVKNLISKKNIIKDRNNTSFKSKA